MMHWQMNGEFICRWIPDPDGYTSSAIMYLFLEDIGCSDIKVGLHEGKEHGLDLKECLSYEPDLAIIPDASGNPEDYEKLNSKGIKSIIIDHHEYDMNDFPTTVVNCHDGDYPNPNLSGAGVALKVCQYYAQKYNIDYNFNRLYVLAAVGIVADVMSLQELENQYIIRYGLQKIKENDFFNELLKDRMGNPVEVATIHDIGWSIGPNMNAVIRLGSMEEKQMLFDTLISPRGNVISQKRGANGEVVNRYTEMCRICKNLKAKQNRLVQNAIKIIEPTLNLKHNLIVYVDKKEELPFELSGLIANRLLSSYQRPVLILKNFHDYEDPSQEDCWAGSMRSIVAEGFEDPRADFEKMSGVRSVQGHSEAAGCKIYKSGFDSFLAEAYEKLDKVDFNNQLYTVEAVVKCRPFPTLLGKVFAQEDIWGSGIAQPYILVQDIDCIGAEYMGREGQHVKIVTPNIDFVIFDDSELINTLRKSKKYTMNAVGIISWNDWEEQPKLQMIVESYELKEKEDDGWSIYDF